MADRTVSSGDSFYDEEEDFEDCDCGDCEYDADEWEDFGEEEDDDEYGEDFEEDDEDEDYGEED